MNSGYLFTIDWLSKQEAKGTKVEKIDHKIINEKSK